jgi:hypothetical protein
VVEAMVLQVPLYTYTGGRRTWVALV